MVKSYLQFMNEAEDFPAQPAAQPAPAQPAPAQPAAQPAPAQPAAQSGSTETTEPSTQGEQKSGDLSSYNNPDATKFTETVKKMVDIIKDLDKTQLIELRDLLAKFKSIEDAKNEIGKL